MNPLSSLWLLFLSDFYRSVITICICLFFMGAENPANAQIVTVIDIIEIDAEDDSTNMQQTRKVSIFPNPVTDFATILVPGSSTNSYVNLMDDNFVLIEHLDLDPVMRKTWELSLDSATLSPGTYYLAVSGGPHYSVHAIIIN